VKAGREVLRQSPEFQRLQRSLERETREGRAASVLRAQ
jgi:hypothetical protein